MNEIGKYFGIRFWLTLSMIGCLILALFSQATVTQAANLTVLVDTTIDSNAAAYQACTAAAGDCSLRGAISKTKADTTNFYTIQIPPGSYILSIPGSDDNLNATGDLDIKTGLVIEGLGSPANTVIDGAQIDRVFQIHDGTVTIKNLKITGGKTPDGVAGGGSGGDGGGIQSYGTLTVQNCEISNNKTGKGGDRTGGSGGYGGNGGGIYSYSGETLTVIDSVVANNSTGGGGSGSPIGKPGSGGGIFSYGAVVIQSSAIRNNTVLQDGGGLYLSDTVEITGGSVEDNSAQWAGGGVYINRSDSALLNEILISNNRASTGNAGDGGGGIYLYRSTATFQNLIVAGNSVGMVPPSPYVYGAGIYLQFSNLTMLHTTIASNTGGDGGGVYATHYSSSQTGDPSTVTMKNTIVAGHTIGIEMDRSNATMDATLWGSGDWLNGTKTKNTDTSTNVTTNDYDGDPVFVDATNRNYHLGASSAAIDKGVATTVTLDVDQEARSNGQPDLGADEAWPCTIIDSVTVNGPVTGSAGSILAFQASTSPQNATIPIRYHWTPEPFSGQGKASVAYKFSADGSQSISVLAQNCAPGANGNKEVEIITYYVQIPVVMKSP